MLRSLILWIHYAVWQMRIKMLTRWIVANQSVLIRKEITAWISGGYCEIIWKRESVHMCKNTHTQMVGRRETDKERKQSQRHVLLLSLKIQCQKPWNTGSHRHSKSWALPRASRKMHSAAVLWTTPVSLRLTSSLINWRAVSLGCLKSLSLWSSLPPSLPKQQQ